MGAYRAAATGGAGEATVGRRVTVVDGRTPREIGAARRVVDATGVGVEWDEIPTPRRAAPGDPRWEALLASARRNGAILKGPLPTGDGARNANVALRLALDLFAGVRPCRSLPGVASRYADVDLVVIREHTEDLYVGVEFAAGDPASRRLAAFVEGATGHHIADDAGISLKANSVAASERIVSFAFAWASSHGRGRVTAGHKANIMKFSDGLFLEAARRVAQRHPEVSFDDRIIDALSMQLVQRPAAFDVLVLPNLYGDLVSGLCAGLVGGPSYAPGASIGDGLAAFGPAREPDAGDPASSVGAMLSAAMLLSHLGEDAAAARVDAAVRDALAAGPTGDFADEVVARLRG